ncbi:MAG TPA: alpha/beta hydrolase-fold protein [Cellvibrio sp.]|nr:alpha/beta hydrolase-fold protein [Cellvibrio sp.]
MKLQIILCIALFFSITFLSIDSSAKAFEIPRTKVVKIQDSATKRFYELYIQLPLEFVEGKKYPVVYMVDSLHTFPIISGSIQLPIMFHRMEDIMLVGISWETKQKPFLSRQRDYTPSVTDPASQNLMGQADKHLSFIRNDVINYVEKNYTTDPEQRTFVGHSFGGLLGTYILLTQPSTFKNYLLSSPSLWWDDKYILKLENEIAKSISDINANVYISDGALESDLMHGPAKELTSLLESRKYKNLSLQLAVIEAANHETAFPTAAIRGLSWFYRIEVSN